MRIIILIPAHNEAQKIYQVAQNVISRGFDVVVVDDGSSDQTFDEAQGSGARVLRHFINRGYGAALETGNQWALQQGYDVIVHFDGDGQHNADEIQSVIGPIINNQADVVIGSRFKKRSECCELHPNAANKIPMIRRMLIKFAIMFTWIFSGIKLTDAHNGFRAFSRRALEELSCHQDGMAYASEVIDQIAEHKLRVAEIPVTIQYTDYSKAKGESNIKKVMLGLKFIWSKIVRHWV